MAERKVPKDYPLEKTPEAAEARRKRSFAASKKAHDKIVQQIKKDNPGFTQQEAEDAFLSGALRQLRGSLRAWKLPSRWAVRLATLSAVFHPRRLNGAMEPPAATVLGSCPPHRDFPLALQEKLSPYWLIGFSLQGPPNQPTSDLKDVTLELLVAESDEESSSSAV
ncbi:hypothetical protein WJX73_007146 [Symbiochloris irregularis]|uniref:Uncharacterized protein n=1 Tax=Symbiochloris irregularis TaxID=706552 RepID=A0AAW1PCB1_9CHLO